jgi:hypothetical protein
MDNVQKHNNCTFEVVSSSDTDVDCYAIVRKSLVSIFNILREPNRYIEHAASFFCKIRC